MPTFNTYVQNLVFSSQSSQSATILTGFENLNVMIGDLYVSSSSSAVNTTATLTFYNNADMADEHIVFIAQMQLAYTNLSTLSVAGNGSISVNHGQGFSQFNQIQIFTDGTNPAERRRILSINGNTLNLIDTLQHNHNNGSAVANLPEFGGITLQDVSNSQNLYVTVSFPSSVTLTLTLEVTGIPIATFSGANQNLSNLLLPTAINQSLLFSPDNTLNIGATGATRPANVHVATAVYAPLLDLESTGTLNVGTVSLSSINLGGNLSVLANGTVELTAGSSANLVWGTDGSGSIGLSTGNRPSNAYVLTSVSCPTFTGPSSVTVTAGGSNNSLTLASTGGVATLKVGNVSTSGNPAFLILQGALNTGTGLGGTIEVNGGNTTGGGNAGFVIVRGGRTTSGGNPGSIQLGTGNNAQPLNALQVSLNGDNNVYLGNASPLTATNLLWTTDKTGDIGSPNGGSTLLRPNNVWIGGSLNLGLLSTTSLTSVTLTDNTSSPTTAFSYTNDFSIIEYSIARSTDMVTGTLMVATDGTNVNLINQTVGVNGDPGVVLSATVSGGTVSIKYTTTSTGTNATLKWSQRMWS